MQTLAFHQILHGWFDSLLIDEGDGERCCCSKLLTGSNAEGEEEEEEEAQVLPALYKSSVDVQLFHELLQTKLNLAAFLHAGVVDLCL